MTPPSKWLFFPTQSASGNPQMQITTTLQTKDSSTQWQTNTSGWAISGADNVANNYQQYTSGDIRRSTNIIDCLFRIQSGSPDYANSSAWNTARVASGFIFANCSVVVGGNTFSAASSVSSNRYGPRLRFVSTTSDATSFFDGFTAGDSVVITADWN